MKSQDEKRTQKSAKTELLSHIKLFPRFKHTKSFQ